MGDEYWGTSSVTKKVNQQKIFDIDGTNTLDRFKNRSDPLIEQILDSSRSTQVVNTTGVKSARFRSSETTTTPAAPIINNPLKSAATKIIPDTQPKITIPASQVSRPFDQPTEFGQKVEQTFNLTNSNVFHGSLSSLNDLPDSYYHRESGDDKYDHDDTVSLQNLPEYNPDSPKLKLRKKYAARFGRPQAATSSNDFHSNLHWQPNAEDYPDQSIKDRSTQYDKEMEMRCKDLLENKTVKLDDIREYDKKVSLLRKAVSFNTPSVTVPVMIFLENSLSRPLFYELIKQHPSAVRNYINMAKLRLENDYYIAMLKQFGRHEDVAMLRLRQVSQTSDIQTKMAILDQAMTELGSHPWWHLQVVEQRLLLTKQRELQTPQNNRTVLETYKTLYETDFRRQKQSRMTDKITNDRSKEFETTFHMSPELIMCGKLSVIMHCDLRTHYDDFIHQAIHQGIFGKKYIIAPEYLADMVHNWVQYSGEGQDKASEKTERFLTMIPDPNKRIYFAEKFLNYDVAIDTIVNILRDRVQLEILRRRMPHDHPSYNRATTLLENTKWRN
ncbi:unnamed protein product [Adineta steineri]|uniref:Uncharacterized protein n=1 Tax=Adineta steineri TaxID=433720 RepID=A0A818TWX2_9BILA|nr:unnamed protein product [Adineta steineri]CAF3689936.1 unnamed protein product [Adineta steineri]